MSSANFSRAICFATVLSSIFLILSSIILILSSLPANFIQTSEITSRQFGDGSGSNNSGLITLGANISYLKVTLKQTVLSDVTVNISTSKNLPPVQSTTLSRVATYGDINRQYKALPNLGNPDSVVFRIACNYLYGDMPIYLLPKSSLLYSTSAKINRLCVFINSKEYFHFLTDYNFGYNSWCYNYNNSLITIKEPSLYYVAIEISGNSTIVVNVTITRYYYDTSRLHMSLNKTCALSGTCQITHCDGYLSICSNKYLIIKAEKPVTLEYVPTVNFYFSHVTRIIFFTFCLLTAMVALLCFIYLKRKKYTTPLLKHQMNMQNAKNGIEDDEETPLLNHQMNIQNANNRIKDDEETPVNHQMTSSILQRMKRNCNKFEALCYLFTAAITLTIYLVAFDFISSSPGTWSVSNVSVEIGNEPVPLEPEGFKSVSSVDIFWYFPSADSVTIYMLKSPCNNLLKLNSSLPSKKIPPITTEGQSCILFNYYSNNDPLNLAPGSTVTYNITASFNNSSEYPCPKLFLFTQSDKFCHPTNYFCISNKSNTITFEVHKQGRYYVALESLLPINISANVSVVQAYYDVTKISKECSDLSLTNQSCNVKLCDSFCLSDKLYCILANATSYDQLTYQPKRNIYIVIQSSVYLILAICTGAISTCILMLSLLCVCVTIKNNLRTYPHAVCKKDFLSNHKKIIISLIITATILCLLTIIVVCICLLISPKHERKIGEAWLENSKDFILLDLDLQHKNGAQKVDLLLSDPNKSNVGIYSVPSTKKQTYSLTADKKINISEICHASTCAYTFNESIYLIKTEGVYFKYNISIDSDSDLQFRVSVFDHYQHYQDFLSGINYSPLIRSTSFQNQIFYNFSYENMTKLAAYYHFVLHLVPQSQNNNQHNVSIQIEVNSNISYYNISDKYFIKNLTASEAIKIENGNCIFAKASNLSDSNELQASEPDNHDTSTTVGIAILPVLFLLTILIFSLIVYVIRQMRSDRSKSKRVSPAPPAEPIARVQTTMTPRASEDCTILASNEPHTELSFSSKSEKEAKREAVQKALEREMKKGQVSLKNIKIVICGPPGVGKTAFKDLLLNKKQREKYKSTPIARPIQAIERIGATGKKIWEKANTEDSYKMLSAAINEGSKTSQSTPASQSDEEPVSADTDTPTETRDVKHSPKIEDTTPRPRDEAYQSEKCITEYLLSTEKNLESQKLLEATWIHLLDSGGQPQFTDLLRMFVRDNSLYIIVMKATESLHDKPKFIYSDEANTAPEYLTMTNLQIIEKSVHDAVALSNKKIAFVILMTHIDQCENLEQTLEQNNEELQKHLSGFLHLFIFYNCDSNELIFPVNNLCEHDRENISANIRSHLFSRPNIVVTEMIPIRWYVFDLDMKEEASKETHGMISLQSCYNVGEKWGMDEKEVNICLEYLDSMRLCIYYPEVLQHVVFTSPQFLIKCFSDIVRVSFVNKLRDSLSLDTMKSLSDGVFGESLLDSLELTFIPDLFSKANLLLLLQYFHFISTIKAKVQYFMPTLLPPEHLTMKQKEDLGSKNESLLIKFKTNIVPKGLFPTMVVSLLSREVKPYFSVDCPSDNDFFPRQLRHAVKLYSEDFCGSIFLCEDSKSIEIYFDVPRKHYYVLRKEILKALKASAEKLGYYDEEQVKVSAIVKLREKHYILTLESSSSVSPDKKSDTHESASSTISFYDALERIKCVGEDWETIRQKLKVDEEDMKIIRCRCYHQAAVCCKELMRHWYNTQGQSVSFAQLDNVLPPTEATVSKDYTTVRMDYSSMKDKFCAAFKCFSEEVLRNKLLDEVKETIIKFIEDNLKIDAEAVTEQCQVSDNLKIDVEVEIAKAVSSMKNEIEVIKDKESLITLLQQYCFLSNFSLLKHLADKLDLTESKERLDELTDERDGFYTSLLAEDFAIGNIEDCIKMNNHKIIFVLESSSDTMLADFNAFLTKKCKNLSKFISLGAVRQGSLEIEQVNVLLYPFGRENSNESKQAATEAENKGSTPNIIIQGDVHIYAYQQQPEAAIDNLKQQFVSGNENTAHADEPIIVPKDLTPEQFPEIGDVESQHKEYTECPFVDKVSVILMTATTTELRAVFGYLKKQAIYDTTTSGIKSYIGKYGQYHVAVGITNQGSLDACLCLREMLNSFKNAQYVISVGVCYGMDPNKEIDGKKLFFGDVIVSSNVYDSTVLKVISGEMTSRGIQSSATGKALESMFKTPIGFKLKRMVESPLGYVEGHENVVVRYGPFICNSSVIDDKDYKEKLRANKKDAIAGEMEGTGVMVATGSASRKVEAIVIKGIGDWADGTKAQSSNWKPFAAYAAASYVHHCMDRSSELLPSEHKQQ